MKLLLAIALVAAPAYADAPKYTRKPSLQIPVKLSDRAKPIASAIPPATPITANDVIRIQEVTQTYRVDQEKILEQLVAETPDDDADKPDLMFRLAEHYARQQRFWRLKAIEPTMPKP